MVRVAEKSDKETRRLKVRIHGAVQGVGFRPFVYRIAAEMKLYGWVTNTPQGVLIEVEGLLKHLNTFIARIHSEKPPLSSIHAFETAFLDPIGCSVFEIRESTFDGAKTAFVLPDIATCSDCRAEIFDVNNRRYLYPFTNCTNCGPRFTIIQSLPYDRVNTTMKSFRMCEHCEREYHDPSDRRFHAQPNACAHCGPHVELWDRFGSVISTHHSAITESAQAILDGSIVAVKGLGGYLLMCDARRNDIVQKLRNRKHREEKPFALMFPSIKQIERECDVSDVERRLLLSPQAPIVLLKMLRNHDSIISSHVAPKNPYLGVMLPYTPVHHLMMSLLNIPVVATSGNITDDPICYQEGTAVDKLHSIADMFLVHNRPIERYCDDSIVRVVRDRKLMIRRSRGYAPLPVHLPEPVRHPMLAVGGQLKNTIAVAHDDAVFVSQHIGDLETADSLSAWKKTINDFRSLYTIDPLQIIHDLHPEYLSTTITEDDLSLQHQHADITTVQHHYAHIAACMAENEITDSVIGFSWDGTGYGTDGTIWGGECILYDHGTFRRVGTIHSFKLAGGESAVREPRRSAAGILHEMYGDECFNKSKVLDDGFLDRDRKVLCDMLTKNVNTPWTTSIGRMFDAVAAFCGVRMKNSFEGQAAMELEFLASSSTMDEVYPVIIEDCNGMIHWNWKPMVEIILADMQHNRPKHEIARVFHNTLSEVILSMAVRQNVAKVVLSGGCFQNMILLEQSITLLRKNGFLPYWHQRIPANDGGISLGQIYVQYLAQHHTINT